MLCTHGARFRGTQKRLRKTNPGDYVTWNTGQSAESHRKKTILLCGDMPLLATLKLDLLHSRELGKSY